MRSAGAAAGSAAGDGALTLALILRPRPPMEEAPKSFVTRVNGMNMHGYLAGDLASEPTPIVLVHGIGVSARYFLSLARRLARDTLVLAPDLPGSGGSDRPARALDVPELSDSLETWLKVLGLGRVTFVANSFGCQVVADLAARHPERVDRLVFIGPTVDYHWKTVAKQIPRWLIEATRESIRLFPTLIWDYLRFGLRRFLATARFALAHRFAALLPRVRAETLVLRGARDAFVSRAWMAQVTTLLPHAIMAEIPDAPHAAHYSDPDAVASVVQSFLEAGRRQGAVFHEGAVQRVSR